MSTKTLEIYLLQFLGLPQMQLQCNPEDTMHILQLPIPPLLTSLRPLRAPLPTSSAQTSTATNQAQASLLSEEATATRPLTMISDEGVAWLLPATPLVRAPIRPIPVPVTGSASAKRLCKTRGLAYSISSMSSSRSWRIQALRVLRMRRIAHRSTYNRTFLGHWRPALPLVLLDSVWV